MSNKITATGSGAAHVKRQMKLASQKYQNAMAAAIYQKGSQIMAGSVIMCPVDQHDLIISAFVAPPEMKMDGPKVQLGYGTKYAVAVHELTGTVNWTKPGSGSKYLQRALDAHMQGYADWIARKTQENFNRGLTGKIGGGAFPEKPKGS